MKRLIFMMILILNLQIVSSQTVSTDTKGNQSITLSKEKKIDIAKIILNEQRLFEKSELQKMMIKNYSFLTDKLTNKNIELNSLIENYKDIIKLEKENVNSLKSLNENLKIINKKELDKEKRKKWKILAIGLVSGIVVSSI